MLISSLSISTSLISELGLHDVHMTRLGRMVAIAGKNGAGKSRLLNGLYTIVSSRNHRNISQINSLRTQVQQFEQLLNADPNNTSAADWKRTIETAKIIIGACTTAIESSHSETFRALKFVPKVLKLDDPRQSNLGEISARAQKATEIGHENYHSSTLFYIHNIINSYHDVTHQNYDGPLEERTKISDSHEAFQSLVEKMLGTRISRQPTTGYPIMFGLLLGDAKLSDGQKIMLQLCVALHSQQQNIDRTVLIFDEPENHLHPSAVVDVVKAVYERTTSAQIWVATHSVPLLAYMSAIDPKCLWYMDKGVISHAGRNPEIVLESLLGGEDGVAELAAFTNLPAQLAAIRYATESLRPPEILAGGNGDPQISQIQRQLQSLRGGEVLPILDFGSGRGRLLEGLAALCATDGTKVSDVIDYFAFDPFPNNKSQCIAVIAEHFGNGSRYFSKPDDFLATKDKGCISVVVMTNVLHEIPPRAWPSIFGKDSLIADCLTEDGYVLIVEDQRIPVGEKAHEYGFLVLDTVHLKALFGAREQDTLEKRFMVDDARADGRLKAHLISRSLLKNVSAATVRESIVMLQTTAKREIAALRQAAPTFKNGQLHGFWTQQFANASLAIEESA